MRIGRRFGALALSAVAALAGCGKSEAFRPLSVGDPAPEYGAVTLAGATVSVSELRGRVVLLNVWATWCVPCREEMPALQALHEELEDEGLVVFGVSVDRPGAREEVARFVHEHGIEFAVAVDGTFGVQQAFHTIGVPESFLIDRDGRIAFHWIGPFDPGEDAARAAVLAVLNR